MIRKINKYKPVIVSIFLTGYLSFVLLSIMHFHGNSINNKYKASEYSNKVFYSTVADNDENCPICISFSSININANNFTFPSTQFIENCPLLIIASCYKFNSGDVNYLRGPPIYNIHSV
jgi:hypothetical protein